MTDPLLTIEDATREFRVSPKTIRRRLTSGDIPGAYKRPGNRGPEWVMPRESLAEAGFPPRLLAPRVELPADAEERASYWERRATDAEAALRGTRHGSSSTPRKPASLSGLAWTFVGLSVAIAVLAGLFVVAGDGSSGSGDEPAGAGATGTVAALLEQHTDRGEAVGLVGEQRSDAIPAGRVAAASPAAGWGSAAGPRFVVATFDGADVPSAVVALRTSAELLVRTPHRDKVVEVYDRGARPPESDAEVASPDAPADSGVPTTNGPTVDTSPPVTEAGPPVGAAEPGPPPATAGDAETPPTAESADEGAPAPEVESTPPAVSPDSRVQVAAGESFWSIAERVVSEGLGSDAKVEAVTAYWSTVVAANADQLVDPGNADLLLIGQTIVLPVHT